MFKVRRALISVSDKRDLVSFARGLADLDVEILSTGGTCRQLREAGIDAAGSSSGRGTARLPFSLMSVITASGSSAVRSPSPLASPSTSSSAISSASKFGGSSSASRPRVVTRCLGPLAS